VCFEVSIKHRKTGKKKREMTVHGLERKNLLKEGKEKKDNFSRSLRHFALSHF